MTTNTTYNDIATRINAMTPEQRYETAVVPHDDNHVTADDLEYYASEMRNTTRTVLAYFGVTFDDNGITYTSVDALNNAYKLCAAVADAYESDDDDILDAWNTLSLGGDDDVDYNSSYITILLDLVRPADMNVDETYDDDFLNLVDSITTAM